MGCCKTKDSVSKAIYLHYLFIQEEVNLYNQNENYASVLNKDKVSNYINSNHITDDYNTIVNQIIKSPSFHYNLNDKDKHNPYQEEIIESIKKIVISNKDNTVKTINNINNNIYISNTNITNSNNVTEKEKDAIIQTTNNQENTNLENNNENKADNINTRVKNSQQSRGILKTSQVSVPFVNGVNTSQITFNPNSNNNFKDKETLSTHDNQQFNPTLNALNTNNSALLFNNNNFNSGIPISNTEFNNNNMNFNMINTILKASSTLSERKLSSKKNNKITFNLREDKNPFTNNHDKKNNQLLEFDENGEVKYPEIAIINNNQYYSNYDSNQIDSLDVEKHQQEIDYNNYLEKKKRKKEGTSFTDEESINKTNSVKGLC